MLKYFPFFIVFILTLSNCKTNTKKTTTQQQTEQKQFRNVNWNMTVSEVKENEDARLNEKFSNDSLLTYETELFNKKCGIAYAFSNGKLKASKYIFMLNPLTDKADELYFAIQKTLKDKYGKPNQEEINWSGLTSNLPIEKRKINESLMMNDVTLNTDWTDTISNPNRIIFLSCRNINRSIIVEQVNSDFQYYMMQNETESNKTKQNF